VTTRSVLKVGLVSAVVVSAGLAAVLGWVKFAPRRVPSGQVPLVTLDSRSLESVRAAFNRGEEEVRVLALLSPT